MKQDEEAMRGLGPRALRRLILVAAASMGSLAAVGPRASCGGELRPLDERACASLEARPVDDDGVPAGGGQLPRVL